MKNKVSIAILVLFSFTMLFVSIGFGDVVVLFDEDGNDEAGDGGFAGLFTSHDGGSTVTITDEDSISGKVSAFCTPQQSYNNVMAGMSYSIDEYPYITFAWRKDGGAVIVLQLAHDTAWAHRYYSGGPIPWEPGIQLSESIPEDWVLNTRNLVEDFGADWNLTGIAFSPWDGNAGFYDFMVLHSDPEPPTAVEPGDGKLLTTWAGLKSE